ncbi:MAG: malonyl-ACP O-methyltransferase BioC [Methylococcales bacterium]
MPHKSRVKASFDRAASSYDVWALLQRRIGERLLRFLPLDDLSNATILDLGAGTGYWSRRFKRHNTCVIDLDLSPAMLIQARCLDQYETLYVCGDAESLPLAGKSVDLIFSNLMMQWCRDLERLLKEVWRILKPGGIFLFSTFGPETLCELRDAWKRADRTGSHVNEFADRAMILDAISGSGLENRTLSREIMEVQYENVMELMRTLKGIGARNVCADRPRTLGGKQKIARMIAEYRKIGATHGIPATFEVIFGLCGRSIVSRDPE